MWDKLGRTLARGLTALLMGAAAAPTLAQTLVVAADSSMAEALQVVARAFEAANPGVQLRLKSGAAGVLLDQLAQGEAADVLTSDDADTLALGRQRRLLVPDLRSVFASNALVLVVPASLQLPVQRLSDLGRPEVARIAMGRQPDVPAGRYAREAINAQRLWPSVQRKIVAAADVRAVLDLVARADVEAGFVYATDAATAPDKVRVVERLPTTTPISYQASVVVGSRQAALARAFVEHLRGAPAQAVFKRFGFGPP